MELNKKKFEVVEKPVQTKKGVALDNQEEEFEYVCVGENKMGIRTFALRKK